MKAKHWNLKTFIVVKTDTLEGFKRYFGFCAVCKCDMADLSDRILRHYKSHKWERVSHA